MALASNPMEVRVHLRLTREYIDAEPATIVLKRPARTTTAAGGVVEGEPTTLAPQKVRLIPFKRRLTEVTRNTPDGDIHALQYSMMTLHDADVQKDDYFDYEGKRFEVVSMEPNDSYKQVWNLTYRGATDGA